MAGRCCRHRPCCCCLDRPGTSCTQRLCAHEYVVKVHGWSRPPAGVSSPGRGYHCIVMEQCVCSLFDAVRELRRQQPAAAAAAAPPAPAAPAPTAPAPVAPPALAAGTAAAAAQPTPHPSTFLSQLSGRLSLMAHVAAAVQHMHSGLLREREHPQGCMVLHNDLKAQNVLLKFDQNHQPIAKVRACSCLLLAGAMRQPGGTVGQCVRRADAAPAAGASCNGRTAVFLS